MTLSTQTVIEAFRETGATPVQHITYRKKAGENQCCGIGAVILHKYPELIKKDTVNPSHYRVSLLRFRIWEDLSYSYVAGFMVGWDQSMPDEMEPVDIEAYTEGYQDGVGAWEAINAGV